MSLQLGVMAVESLLLAVALLFLVALLRSHAEILRRLHALESGTAELSGGSRAEAQGERAPGLLAGRFATAWPGQAAAGGGSAPAELVGRTLDGDAVKLSLVGVAPRTLLAFLSSGCVACRALWDGLRAGVALPGGCRLVIVTKDSERESPARLRALACEEHELVMSNGAWEALAVTASPHFVLIDGADAAILGRGAATSWQQILSLLDDAQQDSSLALARTTAQRAARADAALQSAGILAGHPSLYPSRAAGVDEPA